MTDDSRRLVSEPLAYDPDDTQRMRAVRAGEEGGSGVSEATSPLAPVDGERQPLPTGWLEDRLERLNVAIALHPDAPANYVLRGELYLSADEAALAVADFQHALLLAETEVEMSDWGLVAQAMQDRALKGLQAAQQRLGKRG